METKELQYITAIHANPNITTLNMIYDTIGICIFFYCFPCCIWIGCSVSVVSGIRGSVLCESKETALLFHFLSYNNRS